MASDRSHYGQVNSVIAPNSIQLLVAGGSLQTVGFMLIIVTTPRGSDCSTVQYSTVQYSTVQYYGYDTPGVRLQE